MTYWKMIKRALIFSVTCRLLWYSGQPWLSTSDQDLESEDITAKSDTGIFPDVKILRRDVKDCSVEVVLPECNCTKTVGRARCPANAIVLQDEGSSTCGSLATLRGPQQKVVSFSLYGTCPGKYHTAFEKLLPRVTEMYPDWTVRLYADVNNLSCKQWACNLICNNQNLDFCNVKSLPGLGDISESFGMTWRYSIMGDPLVDYYMVRDTDSLILQREVDAVAQWLSSGKCFHVMRDNKHHRVPVKGGSWGGCSSWQPDNAITVRDQLLKTPNATSDAEERRALLTYLWPWIKENALVHDAFTCTQFPGSVAFPSQRVNFTFVGMSSDEKQLEADGVQQPCPTQCRPPGHQDWEYC